jgi:hypothetical protein
LSRTGDNVPVSRRRFALLAAILVAVNAFFWLAQTGFAGIGPGILQQVFGGQRLIRAEVVWQSPSGVEDTFIDRGVVTAVTAEGITLRERDGTTATIPLASTVTVTLGYRTGTIANVKRGMHVVVSHPATGPADTIQIEGLGG